MGKLQTTESKSMKISAILEKNRQSYRLENKIF